MNRRTLLATTCLWTASGCATLGQDTSSSTTTTDDPTTTRGTTDDQSAGRTDDFHIEDYDSRTYCLELRIAHEGDPVVTGEYRVEAGRGLTFTDVGVLGTSYNVTARIDENSAKEFTWSVTPCSEQGQNTDGVIRVRDGDVHFSKTDCRPVEDGRSFTYTFDPESGTCQ